MAEHLLFSIRNFAQEFGFFGETHFYTKRWASNVSKPTLPQTKDPNPCMIFLTVLLVKNHRKVFFIFVLQFFSHFFFMYQSVHFLSMTLKSQKKRPAAGKRTAFYVVTCYTNRRFPWLWLFPNSGRSGCCSPADIS